jgi:hypothetical protein
MVLNVCMSLYFRGEGRGAETFRKTMFHVEKLQHGVSKNLNVYVSIHAVRSWLRHYATSQKVAGSSTMWWIFSVYLILPAALGSTQPLTEMSTRKLPGDKGRPVRKAENLTAICEPIV